MAQTRRTHTKSRGGCFECKRRKVKCDERKPICSGCQKRAIIPCEYLSSGSSPHGGDILRPLLRSENNSHAPARSTPDGPSNRIDENLPSLAPLPAREAPSPLAPRILGHFNMEDMNLWHTFVTKTAATIDWAVESEIHVLSLSCDYLMHGVMSTAALHLAYLNPEQRDRYNYLSTQHQDLALGPFRSAMSKITPENCHQVFAFSLLLLVSQYASSRCANFFLPSPEITSGLTSWIICLRGCVFIVQESSSHIKSGPLGTLVAQGAKLDLLTAGEIVSPNDEDDQSLEKLNRYISNLPSIKSSTTIAEMEAYTDAIALLRKMLAASSRASDSFSSRSFSSFWPTQVSDTFIRVLSERRPPALAIMAHYCLLLKRCHSCWYMEHRAEDLFNAIQQSLPQDWTPSVQHPLRVFSV